MDLGVLGDLNWLAVIVATLAYFMFGALWYAPPVFGTVWANAAGISMDQTESPSPIIYIGPLLGALVATIATAMLALATASDTASEGLKLGIVLGVGYSFSLIGVTAMFETNKPNAKVWGAVSIGYHFVGIMISSVIVSIWD